MLTKDGDLTDSQVGALQGLTPRTCTIASEDAEMLFNSDDLLSRTNTLKREATLLDEISATSAAVAAAAAAILEENRNKGINILITAIDKKAAHNAREVSSALLDAGNREASISVNNTQETDTPALVNIVPPGGEPSVTPAVHDSFVGDWMLTQSQ